MNVIKWLDEHFEEFFLCILLIVMFVVMMAQVALRTFGNSLSWAEELTRYCLICSGFLSLGYTVRKDTILKVDIVTSMFPAKIQKLLNVLLFAITGIIFGYLFFESLGLVSAIKATNQISSALRLPMYILYVVCSIGFFLGTVRCAQSVIQKIMHFSDSEGPKTNLEKELEQTREEGGESV